MLVNINAAMFAGLISLTADFGALNSIVFLVVHFCTTFIGTIIILVLQIRQQNNVFTRPGTSEFLLVVVDLLAMLGWGLSILLFLSPEYYDRSLLIIVLLTAAGIGAATLNSRLLPSLILGRIVLFLPCVVYFIIDQPPFWGLLICTLFFATIVSIGIGYAVHVQHLNEANYGLKLREVSVLLEQQSFSLERSLLSRNRVQERLLRETKLRERFLHSVNHDLNQPLSALALYLNDLRSRTKGDAQATVQAALDCLSSAKTLIQSISQLAWVGEHLPPPRTTSVRLQTLLDQVTEDAKLLAAEKNVFINCVRTSVSVEADPDYLERVLRNLIHNAIQYSTNGRILVGVRHRPNGLAEIIVADNGLGISVEHQEKIFEEFYQIDIHGSRLVGNIGLGLSIVKDLVKAMNGTVILSSTIDKGTIFGVLLPVSGVPVTHVPDTGFKETGTLETKRVLLVDDQREYLDNVSKMLVTAGFELETASSADEIDRIQGEDLEAFDYLVLDFNLGDKLTAFDILKESPVNLFPNTLIISQYDNPEVILKVKSKGGRFLKKPFSATDLENALRALAS
ncbi:ATP-binding protein [Hoeflea sp.]|uniref:ATP-binding response regulator n=1 Tax=Hoeflea sp. TaxID=1940281 RepID=UPI003B01C47C